MRSVADRYPTTKWQMVDEEISIQRAAPMFNEFKFFFAPHGRMLTNVVFMQPHTAVCEIQSQLAHPLFIDLSRMLGLYHVVTRVLSMPHDGRRGVRISVRVSLNMVEEALNCLKMNANV
jgi:hypothetical protein